MDLELEGNAALVTASSGGLGKASAKALAREGVNVVVNGREEDRLDEAVADIAATASGDVVGQVGDVASPVDVTALVERTIGEFGRLDHLVTSAGGPPRLRPLEAAESDWYDAYDGLVMSVVRLVHEAVPHLQASGGGTIVTIASRATKEGHAGNVLSSAVRTAVVGFEKTLSQDLTPDVRANAVLPASIETPRVEAAFDLAVERGEFDTYQEAYDARVAGVPLERLGDPMELGDTVAFLSSPRSGFINGQTIAIDGGSTSSTF